jgi:hypothetical protein
VLPRLGQKPAHELELVTWADSADLTDPGNVVG